MENQTNTTQSWRFGVFEVDARNNELRRGGAPTKVREQSFRILVFLLEHAGELVTREDLQRALWSSGTFVDFDHGLNTAVMKLREALGDSADKPLYIETVPKRGYRFIAPVSREQDQTLQSESTPVSPPATNVVGDANRMPPHQNASTVVHSIPKTHTRQRLAILAVCCACVLLAGAGWFVSQEMAHRGFQRPSCALLQGLTFDDGLQTEPTWSPDARYVAYSSDRGGKFDIWVQQVSGGNPIQVTKGPGQNWQPDWSPDGKYIAYRSEEGDGGIFVIPALGGAGLERKIATFGYHPRWSPDSSQVLFGLCLQTLVSTGSTSPNWMAARRAKSWPSFWLQRKLSASAAAWYPDGKKITVWVADSSPTPSFWTIPIAGGPGIKLEIATAVQKELAQASGDSEAGQQLGEYSFSWSPSGDAIYFERGYREARNIWKLQVDPETLRATSIDRLTTGPGPDAGAAVSKDGKRLAFSAKSQRIQTWLFPFDARTGQIKGDGTAITSPGRTSIEPDISRDGMNVAYYVPHGEG